MRDEVGRSRGKGLRRRMGSWDADQVEDDRGDVKKSKWCIYWLRCIKGEDDMSVVWGYEQTREKTKTQLVDRKLKSRQQNDGSVAASDKSDTKMLLTQSLYSVRHHQRSDAVQCFTWCIWLLQMSFTQLSMALIKTDWGPDTPLARKSLQVHFELWRIVG